MLWTVFDPDGRALGLLKEGSSAPGVLPLQRPQLDRLDAKVVHGPAQDIVAADRQDG